MKKWEYDTLTTYEAVLDYKELDRHGQDGWELTVILDHGPNTRIYYFKRELPADTPPEVQS